MLRSGEGEEDWWSGSVAVRGWGGWVDDCYEWMVLVTVRLKKTAWRMVDDVQRVQRYVEMSRGGQRRSIGNGGVGVGQDWMVRRGRFTGTGSGGQVRGAEVA